MPFFRFFLIIFLSGCNGNTHFEAVFQDPQKAVSGDIIIVSGGTVNQTTAPFPLHKVALFSSDGTFKKFLYEAKAGELLYGAVIDPTTSDLFYTVDTIDRVDGIDLSSLQPLPSLLDVNLNGVNMRAIATLSDGSKIIAESPTVIEKYSPSGVRAGPPFPITLPTAINNIVIISGDRFVVTFTTNPDSPRIYSAAGVLTSTFPSTSPCTTNCDPYDVVELSDGRFVLNSRVTHGLYLYGPNLSYLGALYLNTGVLNSPSGMALLQNGNLIVCGTNYNTCEEFNILGSVATRVGTTALINNASAVRQPLSVMVIP